MEGMNKALYVVASIVVGLILVFAMMLSIRWFNAASIHHKVINPKDGIECVVVSTTDGASVDCWKSKTKPIIALTKQGE